MSEIKKILLIEDDLDDQMFFKWALTLIAPSAEYILAKNGLDGIKKLKEMNIPPDLIFLDLKMPLMNGFDCLRNIRENNLLPQIPVIIFSTSKNEMEIAKAKDLGASGYFRKPKEIKNLLSILTDILSVDFEKKRHSFVF